MHKENEDFVKRTINKLPDVKLRLLAWECYKRKYDEAYNNEPEPHKKENKAVFTANTALRTYVNKVITI